MFKKFKILGIIPARSGSKRVPNKNIVEIKNKPLINWTIEEAKKSKYLDKIVLSTDSKKIAEHGKNLGIDVPFLRPKLYSTDNSSSLLMIDHALKKVKGFDYAVLLQPTSPLRIYQDIDESIKSCINSGSDSCVSVKELQNENLCYVENKNGKLINLFKKRLEKKIFVLNGAIYMFKVSFFEKNKVLFSNKTIKYLMPIERSLDIDTKSDLEEFKLILSKLK